MMPSTAPTGTLVPSAARISPMVPAAGDGTSKVTLSVSSSTTGSSISTASPGCFSQRATVASVTDSPSAGTLISLAIAVVSRRQRVADELRLFLDVALEQTGRRRGGLRAADKARPPGGDIQPGEHPLDPAIDKIPGAHVLRLLLAPHHLGVAVALQ